jgi:hypothetical protein
VKDRNPAYQSPFVFISVNVGLVEEVVHGESDEGRKVKGRVGDIVFHVGH